MKQGFFLPLFLALLLLVHQPNVGFVSGGKKAAKNITITHGPMLGRPGAHQMGIWARTSRPGEFQIHYGVNEDKLNAAKSVKTRLENDNTGYIILKNLKSNTKYHYQVKIGTTTKDGWFRTFPDSKDYFNKKENPKGLFNFKFEFACGNNQGTHSLGSQLPTFATMLKKKVPEDIAFAILNGDWLYEEDREFSANQWQKQQGLTDKELPPLLKLAPTITGVWQNYKTYLKKGKNLAKWHTLVPSYYTLDDHEILNDVAGCGQVGFRERRTVFRDTALQAWHDYIAWSNPVEFTKEAHFGHGMFKAGSDVLTDPKANFTKLNLKQMANLHVHWGTPDAGVNDFALDKKPGDPNAGVYEIVKVLNKHQLKIRPSARITGEQTYSIGRRNYCRKRVSNCDFYFLDTRTHRQKHDIKNPGKKGLTMLGKQQKAWLMGNMAESDADFFFVVSSVNFVIPHNGAGGMAVAAADKDDAWTVFQDEREQLIRHFESMKRPVFILTGDLHNSFVVKISDQVWEFASGPHNSRNHPAGSEGNRPATGPFLSGKRKVHIHWSTYFQEKVPTSLRHLPVYCIVQVNNVFNNPVEPEKARWIAYPHPQVIFQYYNGLTGDLLYAEAIRATNKS